MSNYFASESLSGKILLVIFSCFSRKIYNEGRFLQGLVVGFIIRSAARVGENGLVIECRLEIGWRVHIRVMLRQVGIDTARFRRSNAFGLTPFIGHDTRWRTTSCIVIRISEDGIEIIRRLVIHALRKLVVIVHRHSTNCHWGRLTTKCNLKYPTRPNY